MKIGILTDSTAGLTKEFIEENNIKVARLYLLSGDNIYSDGLNITHDEINNLLKQGNAFTTSQPSTADFLKLYDELKSEGCDIVLAIHMSGSLSGTLQNSKIACEISGIKGVFIDSCTGAYALQRLIEKSVGLLKEGKDISFIESEILKLKNSLRTFVVPYSLKQLEKSGRASSAQVLFTNLLNIKILFEIDNVEGVLKVIDKIRSEKKVLNKLESLLEEAISARTIEEVGLMHVSNLDLISVWKSKLEEKFPNIKFKVLDLAPVVGVHTGVGTIVISF